MKNEFKQFSELDKDTQERASALAVRIGYKINEHLTLLYRIKENGQIVIRDTNFFNGR